MLHRCCASGKQRVRHLCGSDNDQSWSATASPVSKPSHRLPLPMRLRLGRARPSATPGIGQAAGCAAGLGPGTGNLVLSPCLILPSLCRTHFGDRAGRGKEAKWLRGRQTDRAVHADLLAWSTSLVSPRSCCPGHTTVVSCPSTFRAAKEGDWKGRRSIEI